MRPARHLVVMAKQPVMGRVKTRLAASIGVVEATRAARVMLQALLRRLARDARWTTWLAVAPDSAARPARWQGDARPHLIAQGRGDLGERMQSLIDRLPPGPAVIIGSDIPAIAPEDIIAAFRLLGSHDAVFGPASDGGYWLVGLSRRCPLRPFSPVRWSGPHALADTLANIAGRRVALLRELNDVDTAEDHRTWRRGECAVTPPAGRERSCASSPNRSAPRPLSPQQTATSRQTLGKGRTRGCAARR